MQCVLVRVRSRGRAAYHAMVSTTVGATEDMKNAKIMKTAEETVKAVLVAVSH